MDFFLASAVLILGLYLWSWRVSRSLVNGPALALGGTVVLALGPAYFYMRVTHTTLPPGPTIEACALYVAAAAALTVGYAWSLHRRQRRTAPSPAPPLPGGAPGQKAGAFIVLALGFVFYAVRHVADLVHQRPYTRAFYTSTRLGYGNYLLLAEAAALLAVLLALVYLRGVLRIAGCAAGVIALGAFGSKGLPLFAILMVVYFYYLRKGRVRLGRAVIIGGLGAILLYGAFWLYSPGARARLGMFFLAYSATARNFVLEVANWHSYSFGGLTLSQNLYELIPRALFPGKPELFGRRLLSARFDYQWVMGNTGDPSFGPYGLTWADFGPLSFLIVGIFAFAQGALIGELECRLKSRMSFAVLVAYLTLVGLLIISGGSDSLLIVAVNIAIGLVVGAVMALRLRPGRSEGGGQALRWTPAAQGGE